jgi:hypothetical protein
MRGFRFKPNLKNIELQKLDPEKVEYFCTTKSIDRIRCKAAGITFNEELADALEEQVRFYYIVKTNYEYDVVPGPLFENLNEDWKLIQKQHVSDKAKKCIDHYIKNLK